MGVFEFIIILVIISTAGKVLTQRSRRPLPPADDGIDTAEARRLSEIVEEMDARLARLEEERDFYRKLLEAPDRDRLRAPEGGE